MPPRRAFGMTAGETRCHRRVHERTLHLSTEQRRSYPVEDGESRPKQFPSRPVILDDEVLQIDRLVAHCCFEARTNAGRRILVIDHGGSQRKVG